MAAACIPAPPGIVASWTGNGIYLSAAGTNHGTAVGSVTFVPGVVGQAFAFDGSGDAVSVANSAELQLQTLTIEAWIKRSSPSRASLDSSTLDAGIFDYAWGGYSLTLSDDGRLILTKVGYSYVASTMAVTDTNNFHHVAVTKTGSTVAFYLDGVAESVGAYDPGFVFNGPAAIGARGGDFVGSFFGAIDEVAVYNRALSASEIQSIYNAGTAGKCNDIGTPGVVVDGVVILTPTASARGSASVTLYTGFPGGWLFYTLDGTDPAASGTLYAGPFTVRATSLLRTIAYNADFTHSVVVNPVSIIILPTLTALTDGGGSVAIAPPAGDYFSNGLAVVTATAAPGWTFLQWLGDATGTNPVVNLNMTRNKTVRAMFGTALNTSIVGGGSIVVSPVSPWYPYGSLIRLTAAPVTGNSLAFWGNSGAGRTNNPLLFPVTNANPTVTTVFASLGGPETVALTVLPDGRGQVTLTPPGNRFEFGTNVVLQATPDAGQAFLGWGGDASGTANPLTVLADANKVVTASFTKRPWLAGEGNPALLTQEGFRVTLTGEFGAAYEILGSTDFSGWTPLGTVTNTWGTVQFTDSAGATNAHRVYRARLLP